MALSGDNFMFGGGGGASQCRTKMHYENPFTMENKSKREKRQREIQLPGKQRLWAYLFLLFMYNSLSEYVCMGRSSSLACGIIIVSIKGLIAFRDYLVYVSVGGFFFFVSLGCTC